PVFPLQALDSGEFARTRRNEDRVMRQGYGSNHQVVRPDRRTVPLELRPDSGILVRGAIIERKRLEWLEEPVNPGPRLLGGATFSCAKEKFCLYAGAQRHAERVIAFQPSLD